MSAEAILMSAYALATQERYDEARRLLASCPEALQSTSGQDLLARMALEQGMEDEAKRIWSQILSAHPDFEPAKKALDAFANPPEEQEDDERKNVPVLAILVLALGAGLALWGLLRKSETVVQIEERVQTNTVERIVNVPVPVTTVVTSVVEKVTIVTNAVPVIQREVVTNIVERVVTKEVEKIVYREPVAVTNTATTAVATPAALYDAPPPHMSVMYDEDRYTWFDRMILGAYRGLGLVPEPNMLPR